MRSLVDLDIEMQAFLSMEHSRRGECTGGDILEDLRNHKLLPKTKEIESKETLTSPTLTSFFAHLNLSGILDLLSGDPARAVAAPRCMDWLYSSIDKTLNELQDSLLSSFNWLKSSISSSVERIESLDKSIHTFLPTATDGIKFRLQ